MTTSLVAVTGNTFPVKDQLKALGARWNPDAKAWMVAAGLAEKAKAIVAGGSSAPTHSTPFRHHKCQVCGAKAWDGIRGHQGVKIYRSGECADCFEERKMGY
jgi:hypothetical protein